MRAKLYDRAFAEVAEVDCGPTHPREIEWVDPEAEKAALYSRTVLPTDPDEFATGLPRVVIRRFELVRLRGFVAEYLER